MHTPGPWTDESMEFTAGWRCIVKTSDDRYIDVADPRDRKTDATDAANAHRIVTCINACEGIPTKWLEQGISVRPATGTGCPHVRTAGGWESSGRHPVVITRIDPGGGPMNPVDCEVCRKLLSWDDLLKACKAMLQYMPCHEGEMCCDSGLGTYIQAQKAIAKAEQQNTPPATPE